jgi:primosomal protein N'
VRSRYRWHVLVTGRKVGALHRGVTQAGRALRASPAGRGIRLDLDIDPVSLC